MVGMNTVTFDIDPRLLNDNHLLCVDGGCALLLNQCQSIPWFIIVPNNQGGQEWHELSQHLQQRSFSLTLKLGHYLKTQKKCDKINTATIGNVVSQLHIHVVGRFHNDPLWPALVWGQSLHDSGYQAHQLENIRKDIMSFWDY